MKKNISQEIIKGIVKHTNSLNYKESEKPYKLINFIKQYEANKPQSNLF